MMSNQLFLSICQMAWHISKMFMSKHYYSQFLFDGEYDKIKQAPGRISDDDDFNND